MRNLITLLLLLLASLLAAQNFRVAMEGGVNGSLSQRLEKTLGHTLGGYAEYTFPLDSNSKTLLFAGAGYQRLNYKKVPVEGEPWQCPGDCIFEFTGTETYRLRSSDISLHLGLERRFGRWSARLTAAAVYRISARVSARLITLPDQMNRPFSDRSFTVKPGEELFVNNTNAIALINYDKDIYLRLGLGAGYALTRRINVGLTYQRMVTNYEVAYFSGGCGIAGCFTSERTRFDARTGSLLATARYAF